jgi:hypothetical protein
MPHCLQSAGGSTLSMAVVRLPDNTRAKINIMTNFTEGSFALYYGQQFSRYVTKWKKSDGTLFPFQRVQSFKLPAPFTYQEELSASIPGQPGIPLSVHIHCNLPNFRNDFQYNLIFSIAWWKCFCYDSQLVKRLNSLLHERDMNAQDI